MNRTRVPIAALIVWLGATAAAAQPSIEVCEHHNFQGRCVTFRHGADNLREWGISNRISSFRIEGGTWRLCTGTDFQGQCEDFSRSVRDLNGTRLQDALSSLRPVRRGGGGDGTSIAVFTLPGFRGKSYVFSDDIAELGRLGLNNQVSSVRVYGGRWQICEQNGYRGCRTVTRDISDLRDIGWNNRISSIREGGGWGDSWGGSDGPGGGWGGGGGRPGMVLYDGMGFRGRSLEVDGEIRDLASVGFNDRTASIRVLGGRWEVCTDHLFRGRCQIIDGDVDRLERGFENRISSVRPLRRGR